MTQPINGNPGISAQELANRAAERDRLQQAKQASDAPEKAENKSEDSLHLSGIAEQVSNEPAFDRAKVDAIKQALQDGSYPLDPRRIAESFVAIERMIGE